MAESSIEISTAPAWLSKLESRREILSKSKIGHETGAGAPCNVCGKDCPGLDLHFWRKLCRNCKCRKDQHDVPNEDLSGWAQFEILGAIRSKPAFLKIEALENQAVHLDWVPPNVTPELAMDYMNQLSTDQIPITGSEAATRRKQQLEYQVPPHDLDPNLCHNLTNTEKNLFEEHIAKVVNNSGQGYVTRLGIKQAVIGNVGIVHSNLVLGTKYDPVNPKRREKSKTEVYDNHSNVHTNQIYDQMSKPIIASITKDKILQRILKSEIVQGIRNDPLSCKGMKIKTADNLGNEYVPQAQDYINSPCLSRITKEKLLLMKIDSQALQSAVLHGWCYDRLLKDFDNLKIDYADNLLLQPIKSFREEYLRDEQFKNEMDNYALTLGGDILSEINIADFSKPQVIEDKEQNIHLKDGHGNNMHTSAPIINYSTYPQISTNKNPNATAPCISDPVYAYDQFPDQFVKEVLDQFKPPELHGITRPSIDQSSNELTQKIADIQITPQIMQNTVNMTCQQCKLPFTAGEVAVQTEKSGQNLAWHPKCFVCYTCKELLADLVYFHHKGRIYCARDFADILKIPRCKACDELIFTPEYTAAEGATFHVKHFCCFHCDRPLADQSYIPDSFTGQPLCLSCYESFQAEKCEACHKAIAANEQGVAWGTIHWHTSCFNCAGDGCGKSLLGGRFMVKNNLPLCSAQCFKSLNL